MYKGLGWWLIVSFFIYSGGVFAHGFTHAEIDYQLCFTPSENCTGLIVNTIDNAKHTIDVQAYSFTSAPIMKALLQAKRRGVEVKVLLDKTQVNAFKYSPATFFQHNNVPVWIDYKPNIAHNKVMIIDGMIVVTGSFNFTKAAQERNAENLLILKNNVLAKKYLENWNRRFAQAEKLGEFRVRAEMRAKAKSRRREMAE